MPVVQMCQTFRYSMGLCSFLTQHTVLTQEQLSLLSMVARIDRRITNSQFRVSMGADALRARTCWWSASYFWPFLCHFNNFVDAC